ncbi:MAG: hypothetical protein CFE33_21050 [Pseudorhodobacter sp. PARRP1]|nr:MAG: hypothetical protein CFE33_21050 [Pseudorhodobacter sp. PARRP1]
MKESEWMWEVLTRMEEDARSWGWNDMIDQINVIRRVLTAEASGRPIDKLCNVVHVRFRHLRPTYVMGGTSY